MACGTTSYPGWISRQPTWVAIWRGEERDGEHGRSVAGMGPSSARITADPDQPVMFVEIAYRLQPLIFPALVDDDPIVEIAAMPLRVERDTSSVIAGDATKSNCR